jgi:hypothetical protein
MAGAQGSAEQGSAEGLELAGQGWGEEGPPGRGWGEEEPAGQRQGVQELALQELGLGELAAQGLGAAELGWAESRALCAARVRASQWIDAAAR